ncbi:MAG: 3,4-dihydroxy-2-butanone-4-phosphate synthase, partial [Candidatus Carbobacillus altaicus]|nr:3,4-dihydroxy-2-butanone-4-phosphate synthase [Candidatus Carbobacillus altaicus]
MEQRAGFSTVEEAIAVLKRGGMIVLVDDADREDEGDLVMLAEHVTPEAINFMITYGRGLVCVPLTAEHARRLRLHLMVEENHNTDPHRTAFTVSIDERTTRTGISAYERAKTIHALVEETTTAEDFRRPGHIFPLIARSGGVLERRGHTEASITLAKLAGAKEVAVICEIVGDDGTMARLETLKRFAKQHALPLLHIAQLVRYEQQRGVHTLQNSLPFKQNRSIFTPDRSQPVFNRSQSELPSYRHSTTDKGTLSDTDTGTFLNTDA